jgi:uncharacterized membrane protein
MEEGLDLESAIGGVITLGTYLAVGLVAVGVALMAATGQSPLAPAPPFDSRALAAGVAALRPEPFLWLGLVIAIGTPSARVLASFVGYLARGERLMAAISLAILAVIAIGVGIAVVTGGGAQAA